MTSARQVLIGVATVASLLGLLGCAKGASTLDDTANGSGGTGTGTCGNNIAEGMEQCDGQDLKMATCQLMQFKGGTLMCTPTCTYNVMMCTSGATGVGGQPGH
jgi:hypothetical protein